MTNKVDVRNADESGQTTVMEQHDENHNGDRMNYMSSQQLSKLFGSYVCFSPNTVMARMDCTSYNTKASAVARRAERPMRSNIDSKTCQNAILTPFDAILLLIH